MERKKLYLRSVGYNGAMKIREKLDEFVMENFELLFEGGVRMGIADYDSLDNPYGVKINETVINRSRGLYYAGGHKKGSFRIPQREELENTINDIQTLIDKASEDIPAPFKLKIEKVK